MTLEKSYIYQCEAPLKQKGKMRGWYEVEQDDPIYLGDCCDEFVCSGCGSSSENRDIKFKLKFIELPESALDSLFNLWERLKTKERYTDEYAHGIPIDNQELKEILTEELL